MTFGNKTAYYQVVLPNGTVLGANSGEDLDKLLALNLVAVYQPQQVKVKVVLK